MSVLPTSNILASSRCVRTPFKRRITRASRLVRRACGLSSPRRTFFDGLGLCRPLATMSCELSLYVPRNK